MDTLSTGTWIAVALVALLYPIVTILLSEFQRAFERRGSPYFKALRQLQLTVLPSAAIYILMNRIAGISTNPKGADGTALPLAELPLSVIFTKVVLTATAIFIMNTLLTTLNAFLITQRNKSSFLSNIPGLLLDLLRVMLVLIGAAIIVSTIWGADLKGALVGLGVGGIVLGLALQDTLSAVFAGLSMVSTRNFKEGDWLDTSEYEGRVVAMDWRSVTIETEQKTLAVVPNSELAQATFLVESSETRPFGEEISIFMAYDDPPEKVIRIIDKVARSIPDIMTEPEHEVEVLNFTDKGIEYELMFFVADRGDAWRVRSDFLRRFWYVAKREGLHHTGAQNLHFQTIEAREQSFQIRHTHLSNTDTFTPAGDGFDQFVKSSKIVRFGLHEIIMESGEKFENLYIPVAGSLSLVDSNGAVVQTIQPGDFFVSRAFLTGSDSQISIRADDECEAIAINFQDLLTYTDKNPTLAGRLEMYIEQIEDLLQSRNIDTKVHKLNFPNVGQVPLNN